MEQSVPKRWHIKFRRRLVTQKKAYNQNFDPRPTLSYHVSFQKPVDFQQIRLRPNEFISITLLVSAYGLGGKCLLSKLERMLLHVVSLDQLCNYPISRWLKRLERETNDIRIQYLRLRICGALPPVLLINLWPKFKGYLSFCW